MNKLALDHPFFAIENMQALIQLIQNKLQELTDFTPDIISDDAFVTAMFEVAQTYPHYLITAHAEEGVDLLNDVVVRRYVRLLTKPEEAGQYYPNNNFFQETRKILRIDNEADDGTVQGSAITLAGEANLYHRRNQVLQQQARQQQQYVHQHPKDLAWTVSRWAPQDHFKI